MARTVEAARALPEIGPADSRREGQAFKPLCVRRANGEVMLFVDADGRVMKVVQTRSGEAKAHFQPWDGWEHEVVDGLR